MAKRYSYDMPVGMHNECEDGNWVKTEDHQLLEQDCRELKEKLAEQATKLGTLSADKILLEAQLDHAYDQVLGWVNRNRYWKERAKKAEAQLTEFQKLVDETDDVKKILNNP